jgi:hypothetical protein
MSVTGLPGLASGTPGPVVRVDEPLLDRAADLEPGELRTLDAIRLAAALEIGQDLGVMIAYNIRLRAPAQAYGLAVESPS